jgi:adenylosuccinate synthase
MAITKLDILSRFETVQVCVAYELDDQRIETFPSDLTVLARCRPIYEVLDGWGADITGAQSFDDLPSQAGYYVARLEELLGIPASCISVGPGREQTIQR